jgi:hypothetical protein
MGLATTGWIVETTQPRHRLLDAEKLPGLTEVSSY